VNEINNNERVAVVNNNNTKGVNAGLGHGFHGGGPNYELF